MADYTFMLGHVARLGTDEYLKLGFTHILGGPDHILFVLSLLLAFQSFREIVHLTLTFTVAHSVTLLLAASGLLTVPSGIVEPLIAFSIASMALTAIFAPEGTVLTRTVAKLAIVFIFGLFHGLGFANSLGESGLGHNVAVSLLLFNAGIELGQVAILAIVVPFTVVVARTDWYEAAVRAAAVTISAVGVVWGLQRLGLG